MTMDAFGITDRGVQRDMNQDCIVLDHAIMLYMVADGMGGHPMGEVASQKAAATAAAVIRRNMTSCDRESLTQDEPVLGMIREAVSAANREIYEYSEGKTMGTTLSAAHFSNGKVYIAHIGDSRIYRLRGKSLEALTEDHTEAQHLVKAGVLSREEAENHHLSHVLTKALGPSRVALADFRVSAVRGGDIYLLSSDGLFRVMSPGEVGEVLAGGMSAEEKCNLLLRTALKRGVPDNVSLIVVEVPGRFGGMLSAVRRRFVLHKGKGL